MNKRISAFLIFAMAAILLVGCSGNGAKEDERKIALQNTLEAYKDGNLENLEQYMIEQEETEASSMEDTFTDMTEQKKAEEALAYLFQHLSYKIGDVTEEGENSAVIQAEIEQADLSEATTSAIGELLLQSMSLAFSDQTEEEINAEIEELFISKFKAAVDNNQDNLVTKKVNVQMKKVDGEWKVAADEAFLDAVTGGMSSAITEFAEGFDMDENLEVE